MRDTSPDVSILIVSYNTCALTLACLDSIAAGARDVEREVIVVDNASTDGSAAAIAAHRSQPRLISSAQNLGFAGGTNLAARSATGTYLLLLNPDTLALDGAIDRLVAFARERPEAMIWGGRTLFPDGSLNPSSAWGRITPWRLLCRATGLTALLPGTDVFNGEALGGWRRDTEREVDIVSGCFLLLPRSLWIQLNGFDPLFYMYGEEADLCLRAKRLGARPRVTPTATITHYAGASEKTLEGKLVRLLAAKATLIRRYFPTPLIRTGLVINALWPLTRTWALQAASCLALDAERQAARRESAAVWRRIWRRRSEWQAGYTGPAPRSATNTPSSTAA